MSNNCYPRCPPRMSDGRHFTDYRPSCEQHGMANHKSSYDHRQFLIHNAEQLMSQRRDEMNRVVGHTGCKQPTHRGTMLPEKYVQTCDSQSCQLTLNDPAGLGVGRKYNENYDSCSYVPFVNKAGSNCCGDDVRPGQPRLVERDLKAYQEMPVNPIPFNLTK